MAPRVSARSRDRGAAGPDSPQVGSSASRVQSVDRAVWLLRAVAEAGPGGAGTVALGDECGLNRATAWRILSTLEEHGLVLNDRDSGSWVLGPGVRDIARSAGMDDELRDVHVALEHVAAQSGETAALAVLRGGVLTYIDEVLPPAVVAAKWGAQPVSLHATSTGKVLLAWAGSQEVDRLLPRRLQKYTSTTITDRAELRADLALTRKRGWSTCRGEYDESAWGVSAPVLNRSGRLLAVVSIWGPPPRVHEGRFTDLAAITVDAAGRVAPA